MAFLRFTRDSRGYEYTFLLHGSHLGERPRVLYWYRSAPGVRVGRAALDEDAIRAIEDQYPDVEFDWPHILEVGAVTPPEVERRPERRRRKPERSDQPGGGPRLMDDTPPEVEVLASIDTRPAEPDEPLAAAPEPIESPRNPLLEELVGREIAARLRARYTDIAARIRQLPPEGTARESWAARAESLNPDRWSTPAEILAGVEHADELFDELRREVS